MLAWEIWTMFLKKKSVLKYITVKNVVLKKTEIKGFVKIFMKI